MISIASVEKAAQLIAPIIQKTPLIKNFNLSKKYGANIYLKREDMQEVRSFKIRGALNKMLSLPTSALVNGIVCASAGNHAQGVAYACSYLKVKGTIYMPTTTPGQKIAKVRHFGGEYIDIVLSGDTYDDAQQAALDYCDTIHAAFIHPFDDEMVIAGQGTVGLEILQQCPEKIDTLLVAVGGGGLLSGVGSYFKQMSPHTKIIAVESSGAPALHAAILHGEPVRLDKIDSFADGIAVRKIGQITFDITKNMIDENILVPEGKICSAMLSLYNDEAIVVEPAGAISVAALDDIADQIKGKTVVLIICGGNNDISRTEEIRERALLYEGKKHYFIIRFPQRAGALREFLNVLGPQDDISYFQYTKKNNKETGPAMVGIELKDREDFHPLLDRMKETNINFEHINDNPTLFSMLV